MRNAVAGSIVATDLVAASSASRGVPYVSVQNVVAQRAPRILRRKLHPESGGHLHVKHRLGNGKLQGVRWDRLQKPAGSRQSLGEQDHAHRFAKGIFSAFEGCTVQAVAENLLLDNLTP